MNVSPFLVLISQFSTPNTSMEWLRCLMLMSSFLLQLRPSSRISNRDGCVNLFLSQTIALLFLSSVVNAHNLTHGVRNECTFDLAGTRQPSITQRWSLLLQRSHLSLFPPMKWNHSSGGEAVDVASVGSLHHFRWRRHKRFVFWVCGVCNCSASPPLDPPV